MTQFAEFQRIVLRAVAGQTRDAGAMVPETRDSQAIPRIWTGDGTDTPHIVSGHAPDYPDRDDVGRPARRGAANDYRWLWQDRLTLKGCREHVMIMAVPAGETAKISPDLALNWVFDCAGSVTLAFATMEEEPALVFDDAGAAVLCQGAFVSVEVNRVKGATITWPAGIKWSADLKGAPGAAATGPTQDVFALRYIPGRGWTGFVAGTGMA